MKNFTYKSRAARGPRADGAAKADPATKIDTTPVAAESPAVPGTGLVKAFSDFAFGFRYWGTAKEDFDVDYDEIVIDTKRIGAQEIKLPAYDRHALMVFHLGIDRGSSARLLPHSRHGGGLQLVGFRSLAFVQ